MHTNAAIIGVGQSVYTRRPEPGQTAHTFIRDAAVAALKDAEIDAGEVDGMAVASFSLAPDTAVDLAWKLGLKLRWLVQDTNGGSSAMNMLGHAVRAVETGAASVVLVVGGDATGLGGYAKVAANFNIATSIISRRSGMAGRTASTRWCRPADEEIRPAKIRLRPDRRRAARMGGEATLMRSIARR